MRAAVTWSFDMDFLKFCCVKLVSTIVGAVIFLLVILGIALIGERAPWVLYSLMGLVVVYVFVYCWYEDYAKTKKYRENYGGKGKKRK